MKTCAALFVVLLSFLSTAKAETITSFAVDLHVNKDTSLDVTEHIDYDFQGAQRHGIYRDIPVVYERNGGQYTTYLDVKSVTDASGGPWKWTQSRQGRDLRVKIGDPNKLMSGVQTFQLHYLVRRAVNFFNGAPEIFWNATGDEWGVPIAQASLRLFLPPGVPVGQVKTASYVGVLGATNPGVVVVNPDSITYAGSNLGPRQGLTIVAGLPAGSLVKPSYWQQFLWFFADWWALFVFPILTVCILFGIWYTSGRDVEGNLPAQVEWNPPTDLSPAEVGTLIDESCDMTDIISTLIDLAARGYLRIEEQESTKLLFITTHDYAFVQLSKPVDPKESPLLPHESEFLLGLFGSISSTGEQRVLLSSLKDQFYVHLTPMKDSIYKSLTDRRLFSTNPQSTRGLYQGAGVIGIAGGIALLVYMGGGTGNISYGVGVALAGLAILLSAKAMPAKTALGSRKLRECVGFQRYVKLAEKARIEKLIQDDPTVFGRLLPYAMVLGVGEAWAGKFSGLLTEPPSWYVPYGYGMGYVFMPNVFVNNLGSGMTAMGSTMSSKPQSTAGSGGSGFGGGGFSGGGFGGGGGGSW